MDGSASGTAGNHRPPPARPQWGPRQARPPASPGEDPDFAAIPTRTTHRPWVPDPERDVRLLVNPFLSLIGLFGALGLAVIANRFRHQADWAEMLPAILAVSGPVLAIVLLQCHCLDCGATIRYRLWSRHACAKVLERRNGRRSPSRLPRPAFQLWAWLLIVFLIMIGISIVRAAR